MLFAFVSSSMAVSLGRSSGATLIGRPLDVTVQATLDSADPNAQHCLEADVFYADERQDRSRVRTSVERSGSGPDALIRIRVARPVDEPVVTVYLRAGCVQRTEKRYVLLADVASEPAPAVRAMDPAGSRAAADGPPAVPAAVPSTPRRLPDPADTVAPAGRSAARTSDAVPRVRRPAAAVPAPSRPSARLKLEPIDLSVETFPQLRPSGEIVTPLAASPEQRNQAAALWKALSTQPEDVLEAAAKVAAIEAAVRGLQVETRKNQAAVAELGSALQIAREERYANVLVYGLLAALVLALAGLAYFWRRHPALREPASGDKPWWRSKAPADTGWHSELGPVASAYHTHDVDSDVSVPPPFGEPPPRATPRVSPRAASGRRNAPSRVMPLSRRDQTDFGLSMPHTPRAAKAEELFDVQHQADFFVSIGQEDKAIAILLDHISDDVQASALIYLDLFNLYHKLKREDDYSELAESFNRMFNARIPAFDAYTGVAGTGPGLEAHPATLAHIRSAWPRPAVLTIMEALIFRSPGGQGEPLDPEAFRDLLFLYGIAREIVVAEAPAGGSLLDFDLPDSAHPGGATASAAPAHAVLADALPVIEDPLSTTAGLDIDLTALGDADSDAAVEGSAPAAQEGAAPVSGGHLIDFEALTVSPGTPATGKGGTPRP